MIHERHTKRRNQPTKTPLIYYFTFYLICQLTNFSIFLQRSHHCTMINNAKYFPTIMFSTEANILSNHSSASHKIGQSQ